MKITLKPEKGLNPTKGGGEMTKPEELRAHPMHWEAIKEGRERITTTLDQIIKKLKSQQYSFQEGNLLMEEVYKISKRLEDYNSPEPQQ
jgi:uncharacterized membrane protein YgaE (UPF0421/DUF939 family)